MSGNNERRLDVFCDCSERSYWIVKFIYQGDDGGFIWANSERLIEIWNSESHAFRLSLVQTPAMRFEHVTLQEIKNNVIEVRCGNCNEDTTENEIISIFNYLTRFWEERTFGLPEL